nr:hypothetical protein [Sciscionella marina]
MPPQFADHLDDDAVAVDRFPSGTSHCGLAHLRLLFVSRCPIGGAASKSDGLSSDGGDGWLSVSACVVLPAEFALDLCCGGSGCGQQVCFLLCVHLVAEGGDVDRGHERAVIVADRDGETDHPDDCLLSADCVVVLDDLIKLAFHFLRAGECVLGEFGPVLREQALAKLAVVGGEKFADRGGVEVQGLPEPDVDGHRAGTREPVDVGDAATERDGEVNVVPGFPGEFEEVAPAQCPHLEAIDDPDTEPDSARAEPVPEVLGHRDDLSDDHALQKVVAAAERESEPFADLGDRHPVDTSYEKFKHVECP